MGTTRRRRALAGLTAAFAAVAGALLPIGPAGATNFYGMAGYAVPGNVTSISAEWRIPAIAPGSPLGHGRTLIRLSYLPSGVQMEVGTTEDEVVYHGRHIAVYSAFWNRIGYGPTRLKTLHAGDLVTVSAVKGKPNWRLSFEDLTTHWKDSVANPGVAATTITEASWLQEDPVAGDAVPAMEQSPVLPYPRIGAVRLTHLELNDRPAALPWGDALVMMLANGAYVVPSHEARHGFSLVPATGAERRYLAAAAPFDDAAHDYQHTVSLWTASTSGATRFADSRAYLAAVARYVHDLSSQHWPAAARAGVRALVASEHEVIAQYDKLPSLSSAQIPAWQSATNTVLKRNVRNAQRVRSELGLPEGD